MQVDFLDPLSPRPCSEPLTTAAWRLNAFGNTKLKKKKKKKSISGLVELF